MGGSSRSVSVATVSHARHSDVDRCADPTQQPREANTLDRRRRRIEPTGESEDLTTHHHRAEVEAARAS